MPPKELWKPLRNSRTRDEQHSKEHHWGRHPVDLLAGLKLPPEPEQGKADRAGVP